MCNTWHLEPTLRSAPRSSPASGLPFWNWIVLSSLPHLLAHLMIPLHFLCPQAHLLDRTQDRPGRCGLHPTKAGLPSRQDYNSQVAPEGRDGPPGQGAFRSHQETGHGPAGREGEERQRQGRTLRKVPAAVTNAELRVLLRLLNQEVLRKVTREAQLSLPLWETPLSALTQAFCTVFIPCTFGIVGLT